LEVKGRKWRGIGEDCTMRSFITCTLHQTLLGQHGPPKRWYPTTTQHGVITQKTSKVAPSLLAWSNVISDLVTAVGEGRDDSVMPRPVAVIQRRHLQHGRMR